MKQECFLDFCICVIVLLTNHKILRPNEKLPSNRMNSGFDVANHIVAGRNVWGGFRAESIVVALAGAQQHFL